MVKTAEKITNKQKKTWINKIKNTKQTKMPQAPGNNLSDISAKSLLKKIDRKKLYFKKKYCIGTSTVEYQRNRENNTMNICKLL